MENILIGIISVHIGNGTNELKGNTVANIPVGYVIVVRAISAVQVILSFVSFALFRYLFLQGGDTAVLGFHGHVAQHLDDVITEHLAGLVVIFLQAVLYQVVAGIEAFDDIVAVIIRRSGCLSRSSQVLCGYIRKGSGIFGGSSLSAQGLGYIGGGGASIIFFSIRGF